jgi:hypothetical protein
MDTVRKLLRDRFSDRFDDPTSMMDAFTRHNDTVFALVPADRLLEWTPGDGWEPICERLGAAAAAALVTWSRRRGASVCVLLVAGNYI